MTRYMVVFMGLIGWTAILTSPVHALTSQTLFQSEMSRQDEATQPRSVTPKQALEEQEQIFRGILSCWKDLAKAYTDPGFQEQSAQQKATLLRQNIHDFYRCLPGGSSFQFGSRSGDGLGNLASGSDTEFLIRLSTVHIEKKPSSEKSSPEKTSETTKSESEKTAEQETPSGKQQTEGSESAERSGGSSPNSGNADSNREQSQQEPSENGGYNDSINEEESLPDT